MSNKKDISQNTTKLPAWIYIILSVLFLVVEIIKGFYAYLPSFLFPLFWIIVYIIARRKNTKNQKEKKEVEN